MPRTRAGKLTKRNSSSAPTTNIDSRHQLYEATHVLLCELSTRKLVITELNRLSGATRAKPLASGRNISFRDGNGRGQKQGEIILVGTYNEVVIEMNNRKSINNSSESPEKLQQQNDSLEQNRNNKGESISNSSILLNVVETTLTRSPSPLQSSISRDCVPLSSPSSPDLTAAAVTSDSLPSKCSITAINGLSMQDNMIDTASSITIQHSSSLASELPPLMTTTVINPATSRSLLPPTTIPRTKSAGEALKEIKHLQSLVKSKDVEITKLTEQNKKLKQEVENISAFSIFMPTDDVVVQWVDYLYESIHKADIRDQIDLNTAAIELGIERESMDLCLELAGGDRISTARHIFKHCTNYDEAIQKEHSWQNIDENIVVKICRFVREFFGVSLKYRDDYVRESLANMMRKDSWKARNPDKSKTKVQWSSSTNTKTSSKTSEKTYGDNDCDMNCDDDDDAHF